MCNFVLAISTAVNVIFISLRLHFIFIVDRLCIYDAILYSRSLLVGCLIHVSESLQCMQ